MAPSILHNVFHSPLVLCKRPKHPKGIKYIAKYMLNISANSIVCTWFGWDRRRRRRIHHGSKTTTKKLNRVVDNSEHILHGGRLGRGSSIQRLDELHSSYVNFPRVREKKRGRKVAIIIKDKMKTDCGNFCFNRS